jgi:hypothetical protein
MKPIRLLILLMLFTLTPEIAATQDIPPQVDIHPEAFDQFLCSRRCFEETVTVSLPALDVKVINQLDVVILIDNSRSMGSVIAAAQRGSQEIVEGIRGLIADTRFAIGSFSDYIDTPWQLFSNFTTSLDTVRSAIDSIPLLNGGDTPESYGRALWETARLEWRENAARVIIIFTDAPPQDPDAGLDGRRGTGDDLSFNAVIDDIITQEIRIVGVNSGSRWLAQLEAAAEATEGLYTALGDVDTLPQTLVNLVQGILNTYRMRFVPRDQAQSDWFMTVPAAFDYPVDGAQTTVTIGFCPYQHSLSDGIYEVNLDLIGGQTNYGTLPLRFEYVAQCLDLTIKDTYDDDGSACSSEVFWESPAIAIRTRPDAVYETEFPRPGQTSYVYVEVSNRGPETASASRLQLYSADSLLPGSFPESWTLIGEQQIHLLAGETAWFGPFEWTPATDITALRAQVHDPEDPLADNLGPRCDGNIAQLSRTRLVLDNYSIVPGYIAAAMPLHLNLPEATSADLLVQGDALAPDGVIMVRSATDGDEQRSNTGNIFLSKRVVPNFEGWLTLGASTQVEDGAVYLSLQSDGSTIAGTTVRIEARNPLSTAPPDEENTSANSIRTAVVVVALTLTLIIIGAALLAVTRGRHSN